jgi:hypothetical protein
MKTLFVVRENLLEGDCFWLNSFTNIDEALAWFNERQLNVGQWSEELMYDIIEVDC